jgi:hypothetical protein
MAEALTKILEASDNVACQAFALCENAAEGACRHPVLGAYLSCARCAERLEQTLEPAEITFETEEAER